MPAKAGWQKFQVNRVRSRCNAERLSWYNRPMVRKITGLDELKSVVGEELGYSSYHEVVQSQVDAFAEATGDRQWIHVDPERARSGPFGGTIAHGYLTLSLVPGLLSEVFEIEGVAMGVNYGINRVRFPAPVPVGSRVRLGAKVASVTDVGGGVQVQLDAVIEVEGASKPSLVSELLFRYYV